MTFRSGGDESLRMSFRAFPNVRSMPDVVGHTVSLLEEGRRFLWKCRG
jgi:hypothetical protein